MSPEQLVFLIAKAVFERDQDSSKDKETSEACFFLLDLSGICRLCMLPKL